MSRRMRFIIGIILMLAVMWIGFFLGELLENWLDSYATRDGFPSWAKATFFVAGFVLIAVSFCGIVAAGFMAFVSDETWNYKP